MMTPKGNIGSKDVTLAYDDDANGTIDSKDVTLAYDDDAKGERGSKDVTLAYDDGTMITMDVTVANNDNYKEKGNNM